MIRGLGRIRRLFYSRLLYLGQKRHIFIACFPKSGSTYAQTILCRITGFPLVSACQFYGPNEQDLYEHELKRLRRTNSVTKQHVKGTANNVRLMQDYNIRPVVLVRNISDTLLSLYDHIEKQGFRIPSGYIPRQYFDMDTDQKLAYLIRVHIPWFVSFLLSWREASEEMDVMWVTYGDLFSNQADVISRILAFYQISPGRARIQNAISTMQNASFAETRLNVGRLGRGQTLSQEQQGEICHMFDVCQVDQETRRLVGID